MNLTKQQIRNNKFIYLMKFTDEPFIPKSIMSVMKHCHLTIEILLKAVSF